ncbi:BspA family leucine-rich repeat surface protein [Candidatus Pelagibacter sp. HIMB1623]|uniref:BspA family leucine-rich repeat surface protein n=1 Tax=Candidatus Pelagibacter sp. HIMB1623 TaxID=3413358 RepID=UPI003F834C56
MKKVNSKLNYAVNFVIFIFLITFSTKQANAGCHIGSETFNQIDGTPGKDGKITLNKIKNWASDDDVTTCDVSTLASLKMAFFNKSSFNQDIGRWNTGNVMSMSYMFYSASAFNQNIRAWTIKNNIKSLTLMFGGATAMISAYAGVPGFDVTPKLFFFNYSDKNLN